MVILFSASVTTVTTVTTVNTLSSGLHGPLKVCNYLKAFSSCISTPDPVFFPFFGADPSTGDVHMAHKSTCTFSCFCPFSAKALKKQKSLDNGVG